VSTQSDPESGRRNTQSLPVGADGRYCWAAKEIDCGEGLLRLDPVNRSLSARIIPLVKASAWQTGFPAADSHVLGI